MNTTNVKEWIDRLEVLNAMIKPIQDEVLELRQKILESESEFKVGDLITWRKGDFRGRVVGIKRFSGESPMWIVQRIRKDGSYGERCNVRHYQLPILVKP